MYLHRNVVRSAEDGPAACPRSVDCRHSKSYTSHSAFWLLRGLTLFSFAGRFWDYFPRASARDSDGLAVAVPAAPLSTLAIFRDVSISSSCDLVMACVAIICSTLKSSTTNALPLACR